MVLMVLFAPLGAGDVVVELRVWVSGREVSRFTMRAVGDRLPFSAPPRTLSAAPRRAPRLAPRAPPLAAPAVVVVALAMVAPREVVAAVSVLVGRVMAVPNRLENPL